MIPCEWQWPDCFGTEPGQGIWHTCELDDFHDGDHRCGCGETAPNDLGQTAQRELPG